jgi:hypothetical protein
MYGVLHGNPYVLYVQGKVCRGCVIINLLFITARELRMRREEEEREEFQGSHSDVDSDVSHR